MASQFLFTNSHWVRVSQGSKPKNYCFYFIQEIGSYLSSSHGLNPETIVSTLSKKLGGRLAYSKDSYRTIGASEKHADIIRIGYMPTWDKHAPRQRVAPCNPTISTTASNVLYTDFTELP